MSYYYSFKAVYVRAYAFDLYQINIKLWYTIVEKQNFKMHTSACFEHVRNIEMHDVLSKYELQINTIFFTGVLFKTYILTKFN